MPNEYERATATSVISLSLMMYNLNWFNICQQILLYKMMAAEEGYHMGRLMLAQQKPCILTHINQNYGFRRNACWYVNYTKHFILLQLRAQASFQSQCYHGSHFMSPYGITRLLDKNLTMLPKKQLNVCPKTEILPKICF